MSHRVIVDDLSKVGYRLSFGTMTVDILEVKLSWMVNIYHVLSKLISSYH